MTAADLVVVRIFGRGGHGSAPHTCIDPVLAGSSIAVRLQSIVSREVAPGELASSAVVVSNLATRLILFRITVTSILMSGPTM